MLQPLERQVTDATISVKSLNVDYKLERMMKLEKDTTDLEVSGRHVVQDMDKVSQDVTAITSEMEQIAKGEKNLTNFLKVFWKKHRPKNLNLKIQLKALPDFLDIFFRKKQTKTPLLFE